MKLFSLPEDATCIGNSTISVSAQRSMPYLNRTAGVVVLLALAAIFLCTSQAQDLGGVFNPKIDSSNPVQWKDADVSTALFQVIDGEECPLESPESDSGVNADYIAAVGEDGKMRLRVKFNVTVENPPSGISAGEAADNIYDDDRIRLTVTPPDGSPQNYDSAAYDASSGEYQKEVTFDVDIDVEQDLAGQATTLDLVGFEIDGDPDSEVSLGSVTVGPGCSSCGSGECSGEVESGNGSLVLRVGVGGGKNGASHGKFWIHEKIPKEGLHSRKGLQFSRGKGMEVIRDAEGAIRQVLSDTTFVDLVDLGGGDLGYDIKFYHAGAQGALDGGVYGAPGVAAWKTVRVKNPDGSGQTHNLFEAIENPGQGNELKHEFDYASTEARWSLLKGGLRSESKSRSVNGNFATVDRKVADALGQSVKETRETWRSYSFGEVMTEQILNPGANQVRTAYEYYDNAGPGAGVQPGSGRLKRQVGPDGSWTQYEYNSQKRIAKIISGIGDAVPGAGGQREKTFTYANDAHEQMEVESVGGTVVGRRWLIVNGTQSSQITAVDPSIADPDDASHRRTVTTKYGPEAGAFEGHTKSILHDDGRLSTYEYQQDGDERVTTARTGAPDETGTSVIEGEMTETRVNAKGVTIELERVDIASNLQLEWWVATSLDEHGRVTAASHGDGTTEGWTYDCCHLDSHTDRQGITTTYGYDALGRQTEITRLGITERLTVDAEGRVTKRERIGTDQSVMVIEQVQYDLAGRVLQRTDAAGKVNTYAYSFPPGGGEIITTTFPDGGTRIESKFADGRVREISGTAVAHVKYEYGTWAGGEWTKEIKVGENDSQSEWSTTFVNALGQTVKVEYPDATVAIMEYNGKGQLMKEVDPDEVTTWYGYNSEGEREFTAVSLVSPASEFTQSGPYDGSHRITKVTREVVENGTSRVVERSTVRVWPEHGQDVATIVSIQEQDHYGNFQAQIQASGATTTSVHSFASPGSWTVIHTGIAGERTIDQYTGGRLTTRTVEDNNEQQIGSITFSYDTHGRLAAETDSRTGVTSYIYNSRDQVLTVTTPAPAGETTDLVATYGYDDMGRRTTVTLPDSTVTTTTYTLQGQISGTSGAQTYAVGYTYDPQGRMRTMTTTGQAGAAVTEWLYHPERGHLWKKIYDSNGQGTSQTVYTYTNGGRLLTRTWVRGVSTTYGYNAAGDLTLVDYSDGTPDVTTTYTRWGAVDTVTDGAGTRTMDYEGIYLDSETHAGNVDRRLDRFYDALGRDIGFELWEDAAQDPDHAVAYGYDISGRLSTVTGHGTTHTYGYVDDSNLIAGREATTPADFQVTNSYDGARDALLTVENEITGSPAISKYAYSVNRIGQRTHTVHTGSAFGQNAFNAYGYNSAGEVTGANRFAGTDTNDTSSPVGTYAFSYSFDGIGNRQEATEAGVSSDYTANALNAYTEIEVGGTPYSPAHDADGNLTTHVRLSDGRPFTLAWDGENRLLSFEPVTPQSGDSRGEYAYDGQSRRVRKVASEWNGTGWTPIKEERFFYDGWNMIAVYDGAEDLTETYTWGLDVSGTLQGAGGVGGLLSVDSASLSSVGYYTFDGNGNVSELLDSSGSVLAHYEYGPFGQVVTATGTAAATNRYRFSTKWDDKESTFNYYGYRYYSPETGRWLSRDPIGEEGGVNLFAFVCNKSIKETDYLGRRIITKETDSGYRSKIAASLKDITDVSVFWLPRPNEKDEWILCQPKNAHTKGSALYADSYQGLDHGNATELEIKKGESLTNAFGEIGVSLDREINIHPSTSFTLPEDDGSGGYAERNIDWRVLLWHELVGHGILRKGHPAEPWNVYENRNSKIKPHGWGRTDPAIEIENEARAKLGIPARRPQYFDNEAQRVLYR